jgi:hypothetical protein
MAGPIVHKAAMEEAARYIKELVGGLEIDVGTKTQNMMPDFKGSHGWDFKDSQTGSILGKIEMCYFLIKTWDPDVSSIFNLSCNVRDLCHYLVDAFTIGQLSSEFWGRIDNRIDFFSEFVPNKKKFVPKNIDSCLDFFDNDNLFASLKRVTYQSMRGVYRRNHKYAKRYTFLFSRRLRTMVRICVREAAQSTAWYVQAALWENEYYKTEKKRVR